MKTLKITLLAVWATITFLALISESESLTAFVIIKLAAFASAWLCIRVCRKAEADGLFKVEDDSAII